MNNDIREYPLNIDINVLKHLGINLYSNVPAVLTEVVANSWDADASEVYVDIDIENDFISITDNGHGMDFDSLVNKYLNVGYERRGKRGEKDLTPNGRPVMGRKGVGKLAPFSIARYIDVYTTKDGDKNAIELDARSIENSNGKYRAEEIDKKNCPEKNGTIIKLRKLNKDRTKVKYLVERLARRFSVIGTKEFKVFVKKSSDESYKEITARDRGDLTELQYIWTFGGWDIPSWVSVPKNRRKELKSSLDNDQWEEGWKVKGWIGTVNTPKILNKAAGNINIVAALSRGRLFEENFLSHITNSANFIRYVTGSIEADFLDISVLDDIATSDRQRAKEDDPRHIQVVSWLRSVLTEINSDWSEWRTIDGEKEAKAKYPEIEDWIESLNSKKLKQRAGKMIGTINKLDVNDSERKTLLSSSILAFEKLRLTEETEELVDSIVNNSSNVLRLLSDRDSIEASMYRGIIKNRLDVILALEEKVEQNVLERELQNYIFDHLWLIDPSWERATGSEIIEQSVKKEFDQVDAKLSDDERKGRIDIRYKKSTGGHVIIELKRPERDCSIFELAQQGNKYKEALTKCLNAMGEPLQNVEIVFVIGRPITGANPETISKMLDAINARYVYFKSLVRSAKLGYSEYLEKTKCIDKIQAIVDSIDGKN